jgi:hypothetical protein
MAFRRLIPYIFTVAVFGGIYWLTMIIPNHIICQCAEEKMPTAFKMIKTPLQGLIFTFGLSFVILSINILEIMTTKDDKIHFRWIKSGLTIVLSYLLAAFIFRLLDVEEWNMFNHYRGNPAILNSIIAIIMTGLGLLVLELIKKRRLTRPWKSIANEYIPSWLKLEKR